MESFRDVVHVEIRPICAGATSGVHHLESAAVVKCHGEHHPGVLSGVGDGFADRSLHETGRSRFGAIEWSSDPSDADVVLIEFFDTTEESFVESENVANFSTWTHPVFGGEAEYREPPDVTLHCGSND